MKQATRRATRILLSILLSMALVAPLIMPLMRTPALAHAQEEETPFSFFTSSKATEAEEATDVAETTEPTKDLSYLNKNHRLSASGEEQWVLLSLASNQYTNESAIAGLYLDGALYVSPENMARYGKGTVQESSLNQVVFIFWGREITITAEGVLTDRIPGHENVMHTIPIPVLLRNGLIYISLLDLYRYLGIEVNFAESAADEVHLAVRCPYTVIDLLADTYLGKEDSLFQLDEIFKSGFQQKIYYNLAALDTLLLHYDYNILTDSGAEKAKELYEESLRAILVENGKDAQAELQAQIEKGEAEGDKLNLFSIGSDAVSQVLTLAMKGVEETDKLYRGLSLVNFGFEGGLGTFADFTGIAFDAINTVRFFNGLQEQIFGLLEYTLLDEEAGASPIYTDELKQAAQTTQNHLKNNSESIAASLYQISEDLAEWFYNNGVEIMVFHSFPPFEVVNLGWSVFQDILSRDDIILDDEVALMRAAGCRDIQNVAYYLLNVDVQNYLENDMYAAQSAEVQAAAIEEIRADLILTFKSAIAARRLLYTKGGYVNEEEHLQLKQEMKECAEMLWKAESMEAVLPGYPEADTDDDIRWLSELAVMQPAPLYLAGGNQYYWQYSPEFYNQSAFALELGNPQAVNSLVERAPDGSTRVIYSGTGYGNILVLGDYIYFNKVLGGTTLDNLTMSLVRMRLDGTDEAVLLSGKLLAVDYDTLTLITANGTNIDASGILDEAYYRNVSLNGKYLACAGGKVFYEELGATGDDMADVFLYQLRTGENDALFSVLGDVTDTVFDGVTSYVCDCQVMGNDLYVSTGYYVRGNYQGGMLAGIRMDGSATRMLTTTKDYLSSENFFLFSDEKEETITFVYYSSEDFSHHLRRYHIQTDLKEDLASSGDVGLLLKEGNMYDGNRVYARDFRELAYNDPRTGEQMILLSEEKLQELGFSGRTLMRSKSGLLRFGDASLSGDFCLICLSRGIEDPNAVPSPMRRDPAYILEKRAAYLVDLATGEIWLLYSF